MNVMSPVERDSFIERILPTLTAIAKRLQLSSCFRREDLVQEAALRLMDVIHETGVEPSPWYVHQVGRGAMLDFIRKWSRESRHEDVAEYSVPAPVVSIDTAIDVRRAISELPELEKRVLLARGDGQTVRQIASGLGRSVGNVHQLQKRGSERVRTMMSSGLKDAA